MNNIFPTFEKVGEILMTAGMAVMLIGFLLFLIGNTGVDI